MVFNDFYGGKFIHNGKVIDEFYIKDFDISGLYSVYDVVRVIDGVALFLEDHFERLSATLRASNSYQCVSIDNLYEAINKLTFENGYENYNAKIVVYKDKDSTNYIVYRVVSYYPEAGQYEQGVRTGIFDWERENPNLKILNTEYKQKVKDEMGRRGVFELLLVNKQKLITEGSRSNVFFVMNGKVYTTPSEMVLKGITRKYVYKACHNRNIKIVEEAMHIDLLPKIEGAFLSGTSISVLPIAAIDEYEYNSSTNREVLAVLNEYRQIMQDYITKRKALLQK